MQSAHYQCFSLEMGSFLLDGGAMFGIVPKVLWHKKIPSDASNRIPMKARTLLMKGNNKNILVDTGCGLKFDQKLKDIYGITGNTPDAKIALKHYGLTPSDITDVILTHLHFDHAGGATCLKNNSVVPTYPNARYYVSKVQWEWAHSPSLRDQASYFSDNYDPLMDHQQLTLIENSNLSLFDHIRFIESSGHTPGQLLPLVECMDQKLFFCGDLLPTSAHIPIPWHMGYDNAPLILLEEKKAMLDTAVKEKWVLFFGHDPVVACGTVKQRGKGVELDRILELG